MVIFHSYVSSLPEGNVLQHKVPMNTPANPKPMACRKIGQILVKKNAQHP
jgi:hypothetical protein